MPTKLGNLLYGNCGGNFAYNVWDKNDIAPTMRTFCGGGQEPLILEETQVLDKQIVRMVGRNPDNPKSRIPGLPTEQRLELKEDGICGCLTNVQKDNMVMEKYRIRKLTPKESFRLMNFDDEDFYAAESVSSDTQLYKMAGNSICVSCLCAIFSQLGIKGITLWNEMSEEQKKDLSAVNKSDNPGYERNPL